MRMIKPPAANKVQGAPAAGALELGQVLDQISEAVIVKDLNAVVTYWNREAASLYGYTAHEAIGRPLRNLHAADLSATDYARLLERIRSGQPTAPGSRPLRPPSGAKKAARSSESPSRRRRCSTSGASSLARSRSPAT